MLRKENLPEFDPASLEPGEHLVASVWRVVIRGAEPVLTGGALAISNRYLRYVPAWSGLHAMLHSSDGRPSSLVPLRIPRERIVRVSWERAVVFLRSIRMEIMDMPELTMFGGRETLQQVGAILGAVE